MRRYITPLHSHLLDGRAAVVRRLKEGDQLKTLRLSKQTVTGAGERVGDVFRLADGRLVYVERAPATGATPTIITVEGRNLMPASSGE